MKLRLLERTLWALLLRCPASASVQRRPPWLQGKWVLEDGLGLGLKQPPGEGTAATFASQVEKTGDVGWGSRGEDQPPPSPPKETVSAALSPAQIMHAFSVAPFDQNLSIDGTILTDDSATLGSLGVTPESVVLLKVGRGGHGRLSLPRRPPVPPRRGPQRLF